MPPAAGRSLFTATVIANTLLCREHYRLVLRVRDFPPTAPGQFVQLACNDSAADPDLAIEWSNDSWPTLAEPDVMERTAYLRRPFSLAGRRDAPGGADLDIIHRVVGVGTEWLSHLTAGSTASLIGPLGNRFALPPEDTTAILVAGGVGIPPMLYLANYLGHQRRQAVAFCGALSRSLLPLTITGNQPADPLVPALNVEEFAVHNVPAILTTDDGSWGYRGFVTQALERFLDAHQPNAIIYTCGPEPMMKRVAEIALARRIPCQIAVERAMACGMGTCQSCCIRVRKADPQSPPLPGSDWSYRLACTDGPVFQAADLLW